jgi:tripartite-type tricarboxylate transporter receptor subunit TctC
MKKIIVAMLALGMSAAAQAQQWPTKTVRFINPFPAGGGTDTFARPLSAVLTRNLGQQFIVENQGGPAARSARRMPRGRRRTDTLT